MAVPGGEARVAEDQRFEWATDLKAGKHLLLASGRTVPVLSVGRHDERTTVYNLSIQQIHTFFVGFSSALVHNMCAATGPRQPDYIVTPGGVVVPVPKGAVGPTPVSGGKGFQFTGGGGGHGFDPRTTNVRIMDPVTTGQYTYPNGYVSYSNASGQTVNPYTGQTVAKSDPWWHIRLR